MELEVIISRIKCIDGTILTSKDRHDFVCHEILDKKICLDGGIDYFRIVGDFELLDEDYDVSITTETPIEEIREVYEWGTYGKDGSENYHRVKLKNLSDEHIKAILDTQRLRDCVRKYVFEAELAFRRKNNIIII